jgi:uncharacterized protein
MLLIVGCKKQNKIYSNMSVHTKIKVLEFGNYKFIFDGENITLKPLPQRINHAYDGKNADYISGFTDAFPFVYDKQTKFSNVLPNQALQISINKQKQENRPVIHRLSLNISNDCNMACKYCYANGGNYYTNGGLMDRDTALNAVNFVSRNFSAIELVNFFGGEPTLNPDIIEQVCEYFFYLHARGILPYLPQFGLTTNGYNISSRMLDILRTYNFSVSISLDGPKKIHDQIRIGKNDSGTYDAIVENIQTIISMGIVPEFECTYTGEHYRNGIHLTGLMDFFYDNFQCRTLHSPIVIADPNSHLFIPLEIASELYAEAIRYSINNLTRNIPKSISVATRLLSSLETRTPIWHYCPAGKSSITVNADGNIFACFMLMCGKGFCLGNVNGERNMMGLPDSIRTILQDANKWQNSSCQNCWAQSLCFGCLGEDIARDGLRRSIIPGQSSLCDFKRELIEVFLISAAKASLQMQLGERLGSGERKEENKYYNFTPKM